MQISEQRNLDPRCCKQQQPMTVDEARKCYIGSRLVLSVFLVLFVACFSTLSHEARRIIWTDPETILEALFCIFALKTILIVMSHAKRQLGIARALEWNGINQQGVIVDKWCEDYGDGGGSSFFRLSLH